MRRFRSASLAALVLTALAGASVATAGPASAAKAKPPAQGGTEKAWLNAFMDERIVEMKKEEAHSDTSRVDTAQRVFLNNGNFDLNTPLDFKVYGESFHIG